MRQKPPSAREAPQVLFGAHPVLEALTSGKRTVERVLVSREGGGRGLGRLLRLAREAGVPITHLSRELLERKVGARAVHQGVAALVSAMSYADPDEISGVAAARPDGLLVVLDRVTDPRNLGAILRTAAAAGADGVLLGGEGTVGLTPVVAKASAGALERIPVAREGRLTRRLEGLREQGFLVLVLDPRADLAWDSLDLGGRLAVVAGGEGGGVRPGLVAPSDRRVAIPLERGVDSLNVSVSVGILLFEAVRQRRRRGDAGAHR